MLNKPLIILGAGSWGTALALHLARNGHTVYLWSHDPDEIKALTADKMNRQFLPGFPLPSNILPTTDLSLLDNIDDMIIAVPSIAYRATLLQIKPHLHTALRIVCATKGLDGETGQLLHDITQNILGTEISFGLLSGPSFAKEVAIGHPTAVAIASLDSQLIEVMSARFSSSHFKVHPNHDLIGTEIGSVIKNIIAIATGLSDGMGFGTNTRCAIITAGLQEMLHLGTHMGARIETMIGLPGLGDLILTASDDQSRNRRLGLGLGQGKTVSEVEKSIGQVVEGKRNAELLMKLAEKQNIKLPICASINALLHGEMSTEEAFKHIFAG